MTAVTKAVKSSKWLATCLALLVCGSVAMGQTETATISGLVTDDTGAVVPGAEIKLQSVERGPSGTASTNNAGIYVFASVQPGRYQLTVQKPGFKQVDFLGLIVNVQDHVEQNFRLQLGSVSESITVEANGLNINTTDGSVSTVVDQNFIESIPLNGRSLQPLIALTPGVVMTVATPDEQGQFSVNGQRGDANYFMVDGVSANLGSGGGGTTYPVGQTASGALPGLNASGGTSSLVSIDAIQEFRIDTSSYAPEFGRTPGGQISIATRAGTNEFHGDLFDYFRNTVLDANDWFNDAATPPIPKAPERQNDFGGVLGGPIIKDRTFFFFSYEGLRLLQPATGEGTFPTLAFRESAPTSLQPWLNAFPVPNGTDYGNGTGQFVGAYSNPTTLNATSLRIDHKLTSGFILFGRYNYAPSHNALRNPTNPSVTSATSIPLQTLTVGSDQILGTRVSNDLRFNYSRSARNPSWSLDSFGGAVPPPDSVLFPAPYDNQDSTAEFVIIGAGSLTAGQLAGNSQHSINLVDGLAVSHGAHQLKFGVDYRRVTTTNRPFGFFRELVFFGLSGPTGVLSGDVPLYITSAGKNLDLAFENLSLYAQDSWRLNSRLTLTYGLRWELDPPLHAINGSPIYTVENLNVPENISLAPPGTPFYKTTYHNFAPRIGIAGQLSTRKGLETVVRGGFGIFYDLGAGTVANGSNLFPYSETSIASDLPFPLPASYNVPPPLSTSIPPAGISQIEAADPSLQLPRTYQWNVALEQSLGSNQSLTVTYLGAEGRDLLRQQNYSHPNPDFQLVSVTTNSATSNYNALQIQYQRRLSHGLEALGFYAWSHSIDDASSESAAFSNNPRADQGDSDYDIRHSFHGVVTYNIPTPQIAKFWKGILGGWAVDTIGVLQSAPPVDLNTGISLLTSTENITVRPDLIADQPLYLYGPQYPCGKAFNPSALTNPPEDSSGNPLRQGTLGRNVFRGCGLGQLDLAIRRQFDLTEGWNLQFSAEAFNVLNHPNFGNFDSCTCDYPGAFGQATQMLNNALGTSGAGFNPLYQVGGPRSIQLALKLRF